MEVKDIEDNDFQCNEFSHNDTQNQQYGLTNEQIVKLVLESHGLNFSEQKTNNDSFKDYLDSDIAKPEEHTITNVKLK